MIGNSCSRSPFARHPLPLSYQLDKQYMQLALQHYQDAFEESARAKEYVLHQLGCTAAHASLFNLGFCDRTLSHKLPSLDTPEGEAVRGALQRQGLIKANGRERFRGALVLPIYQGDEVVDVFGYWFGNKLRKTRLITDSIYPLASRLFNANCMRNHREVWLCCDPFDAIAFSNAGLNNVISTLDPSRFDNGHIAQLLQHGVSRVVLAQADTLHGKKFVQLVISKLQVIGLPYEIVPCPCRDKLHKALATRALLMRSDTEALSKTMEASL